jgi:transcriptional regulator with XRE-family HTH domain
MYRLTKETRLGASTVFAIWHGQRLPRKSTLQKLAAVLEIDWQDLDPQRALPDDGIALRDALDATGLSIRQLSKQSGLAYQTVLNIWHGYTLPQGKSLQKIAEVLEVDWRRLRTVCQESMQMPTRLQQIAQAQGYSTLSLAQASKTRYTTLFGAWYGRTQPHDKTFQKIAAVLHVDWHLLLPEDKKTTAPLFRTVMRQVAEGRGLSARQLAEQAGLHYLTVLNAWHGKCVPHKRTLLKLAVVLHVDWHYLQER